MAGAGLTQSQRAAQAGLKKPSAPAHPSNPFASQLDTNYGESAMDVGANTDKYQGPKIGNPFKQIGGAIKAAMSYDPWKKKK